ncbi:MAG: hypothetical protein HOP18_28620 [Deltaproteobacteria bacterium]|jgi:hypothetical protein|nr:hypothetical protein [Deltaproteobacteria bacterium]
MENSLSLTTWAHEIAVLVDRKTLTQEQRQQSNFLTQAQAETVWVKGMGQVVQLLTTLVHALKQTNRFPDLSVLSYAQSPQGTTTYMRRGTLLSVRGLQEEGPTIELEIDTAPPFRADLLAPTVRVLTSPHPHHPAGLPQAHWNIGVSVLGEVVWQRLNPALTITAEAGSEDILKNFLAFSLLTA